MYILHKCPIYVNKQNPSAMKKIFNFSCILRRISLCPYRERCRHPLGIHQLVFANFSPPVYWLSTFSLIYFSYSDIEILFEMKDTQYNDLHCILWVQCVLLYLSLDTAFFVFWKEPIKWKRESPSSALLWKSRRPLLPWMTFFISTASTSLAAWVSPTATGQNT